MLMISWCWKSLKSKSDMMLLKNWHWRSLKSESALMPMKIWDWRSLKSKSASILFVKAMGAHTNDAKVLHKTFVAKITGSLASNAKALNETFFAEVTDSNPVWEWTQQFNPELRLERKAAKGTQADIMKLCWFVPCHLDGWVLMNQYYCSGSHYPALGCWTLLLLMKGCQEAMHPVLIIWLVCELVRNLVHLWDHSLVAVIESNEWPKPDLQLPS